MCNKPALKLEYTFKTNVIEVDTPIVLLQFVINQIKFIVTLYNT